MGCGASGGEAQVHELQVSAQVGGEAQVHELQVSAQVPQVPAKTLQAREATGETVSVPSSAFVRGAFYGDPERQRGADVTAKVKGLLDRGDKLRADNGLFGDPLPGVRKVLFVDVGAAWLSSKTEVRRGMHVDTIATAEEFELSFDIEPTGKRGGWSNILHLTEKENISKEGDRIPGIWFHGGTTRLHLRVDRAGHKNDGCDPGEELPIGKTTRVKVLLQGTQLRVFFGDRQVGANGSYGAKVPARPQVKLYVGDPWHEPAAARVGNVCYLPLAGSCGSPSPAPVPAGPLPMPPKDLSSPTWDEDSAAAAVLLVQAMGLSGKGVSSREISYCAQILASRDACRFMKSCRDRACRFQHGEDDVIIDAAKGAPLTCPHSFKAAALAPIEAPLLAWWLLGDAFERLKPEAFQQACSRQVAALQHFSTRQGARIVAKGLQSPDALQSFALSRVREIWGDVIDRRSCQEYMDRSAEKIVSKITGSDYSAPSLRPVKAWDGPQGTVDIARIVKIGLHNPNVDFKKPRDTAWHGCQARNLEDWKPAAPNTPPAFRAEKSINKAHGGGVYVTPAFEHAVGYAFRKWDRSPRFAVLTLPGGERWNYLTIMQLAVYDRGKPGAVKECRKTWGGLPGDGWDASKLEWIVEDVSKGQIYGILFCFFPDDPPQGG